MNITNLGKYKLLNEAVSKINLKVQQHVMSGVYLTATLISAKLNTNGDPVVGFEVRDTKTTPLLKTIEYTLVNNVIFPTKPINALCDSIG